MKFLLALSIVLFGCTAPITSSRPLKAREFAAGIGYSMDFSQKRDISSAGWSIWMGYGFGNGIDVFSGPLDLVTFPIASFELLRGKPIRSFPT
ncbi:MAG: hypothetical protein KDC99_19945, partial [Cyclobacteriaceae bacterium]|nr:hypothetical protein [Cyclobacteriaceae bacterium]